MPSFEFIKTKKFIYYCAALLLVSLLTWIFAPPIFFPRETVITVSNGQALTTLASNLKEQGIIRSPLWFRIFAISLGGERDMKAGQYYMPRPQNSFKIAWRIFNGDYGVETVRITIPEGFTAKRIADLLDERFQFFNRDNFLIAAPEGYLFPDTYFIPITATASSTLDTFQYNFERMVRPLNSEIVESGKTFEDVVIMASIIEGEARRPEDMQEVSSILWKRLEIDMPLQVDATFVYFLGKGTKDLTLTDLRIDSPYNTYLYRGLPPTPISNPGLASITAAFNPKETEYLYFLTGDDGKMYYSRTHEEHLEKKARYIGIGR